MEEKVTWSKRRRFMYMVSFFIMGCITFVILNDLTSSVAQSVVDMGFITLGGIVGAYVFGATWDHKNRMDK